MATGGCASPTRTTIGFPEEFPAAAGDYARPVRISFQ